MSAIQHSHKQNHLTSTLTCRITLNSSLFCRITLNSTLTSRIILNITHTCRITLNSSLVCRIYLNSSPQLSNEDRFSATIYSSSYHTFNLKINISAHVLLHDISSSSPSFTHFSSFCRACATSAFFFHKSISLATQNLAKSF